MHGIIILRDVNHESAMPAPSSRPNGTRPNSLNAIIQNFKSISTRKVNQLRHAAGTPLWHRDYYERIVRDDRGLDAIRRYIENNPARWRERLPPHQR